MSLHDPHDEKMLKWRYDSPTRGSGYSSSGNSPTLHRKVCVAVLAVWHKTVFRVVVNHTTDQGCYYHHPCKPSVFHCWMRASLQTGLFVLSCTRFSRLFASNYSCYAWLLPGFHSVLFSFTYWDPCHYIFCPSVVYISACISTQAYLWSVNNNHAG